MFLNLENEMWYVAIELPPNRVYAFVRPYMNKMANSGTAAT